MPLARPAVSVRSQRLAVAVAFAVNGATLGSWLPRVPDIRARLDLDLDELGMLLSAAGVGGLLASAAAGALVDRVGSRRASVVAASALSSALIVLGQADAVAVFAVALVFVGILDTVADIGMNVQAAQLSRRTTGSVVQRLHGLWSVGTVLGGVVGTGAAEAGVSLEAHFGAAGAAMVVLSILTARGYARVDDPPEPQDDGDVRSQRPVLAVLAALALCLAVLEGAPGEWAATFGRDVHDASPGLAGIGYLAVTVGMVVGRFAGDRLTDLRGAAWVFRSALATTVAGVVVVCTSPVQFVAVVGFAVTGLGLSVLFPAVYLQAADTPGVPGGLGVGVMSTGARAGFLVSPLVIGALAEAVSLRAALATVLGTMAVLAAVAGRALSRAGRPTP